MNKLLLTIGALLASAVIFTGCTTIGKTKFPEPAAGFIPKQTYAVPQANVWEASLATLERNRIIVTSQDQTAGTIQTDYIEGESQLYALGFAGGQSTRYKFALTIRPNGSDQTRLSIISKVESSVAKATGSSQWTDVSRQNPEGVKQLETWLYEEIEKELKNDQ